MRELAMPLQKFQLWICSRQRAFSTLNKGRGRGAWARGNCSPQSGRKRSCRVQSPLKHISSFLLGGVKSTSIIPLSPRKDCPFLFLNHCSWTDMQDTSNVPHSTDKWASSLQSAVWLLVSVLDKSRDRRFVGALHCSDSSPRDFHYLSLPLAIEVYWFISNCACLRATQKLWSFSNQCD